MKSFAFGFTLIELLVVISVIGVLAAATIPSFQSFTKTQRLNQAAKQVKQDLRSAQNRALSSIDGRAWGIYFGIGNTSYTPFSCTVSDSPSYSYGDPSCTAVSAPIDLPTGVEISGVGTTDESITFDAVSGDVYDGSGSLLSGSAVIVLDLSGSTRAVTTYAGGKIEE